MADAPRSSSRAPSAAAAVAVLAPQEALAAKKRKRRGAPPTCCAAAASRQGVLSGDPAPDAITLLTLVDGAGGAGRVRLEVARDPGFRHVVARRDILTTPVDRPLGQGARDRPAARTGATTTASRRATATARSAASRRRCRPTRARPCASASSPAPTSRTATSTPTSGWRREDLDFVVCLGDYIYAETYAQVGDGRAVRDDPIGKPHALLPLDPARGRRRCRSTAAKYALYRTDPSLRKLHAAFPVVATWDDHEVQNNYANARRTAGCRCARGFSRARRDAAYQAFFEAMPVFPRGRSRIYRTQRTGGRST